MWVDRGLYDIRVTADGYATATASLDGSLGDATAGTIWMDLNPGTVAGTVYRCDGQPFSGGTVTATEAGGATSVGETSSTGTYSLSLSAGTYTLQYSGTGLVKTTSDTVVVGAGGTIEGLDVTISCTGLFGTVTSSSTGAGIEGALVVPYSGGDTKWAIAFDGILTDAYGFYQFADIPDDTYVVKTSASGYGTEFYENVTYTADSDADSATKIEIGRAHV